MKEQEMRILKTGECGSLSGKSTLTYQIGCDNDNNVYLALTDNSGKGVFFSSRYTVKEDLILPRTPGRFSSFPSSFFGAYLYILSH